MAKKRKSEEKKNKNIVIVISVIIVILLVAVGLQLKLTSKESTLIDSSLRRGETRPTLSPSIFNDPFVAETYRIAKDIPHVLDSLICYCFCNEPPFNHKSLLSCYVDDHAAA